MQTLNGLPVAALEQQIFSKLADFSQPQIMAQLDAFTTLLAAFSDSGSTLALSLGENCGAGVKIRETGRNPLGGILP